jgi:hypothetical protein
VYREAVDTAPKAMNLRHLRRSRLHQPVTGEVHNTAQANTQTFIGVVCFLIAALMLVTAATMSA